MSETLTAEAIDESLADLGGRRAVLERHHEVLTRSIGDLEKSIARAIASGAPRDGVGQAHQNLRGLKEERAGIAAALELIARDAETLAGQRHPIAVQEAQQALEDMEGVAIAAMDRANEALDKVLRTTLPPALALHQEAMTAWRQVDFAKDDLLRISPADVPVTLRRDHCAGRWPSLILVEVLRSYLARNAGGVSGSPAVSG